MPKCSRCGSDNPMGYNFCSHCGNKIEEIKITRIYRFVIMGSGGVGKSAISIRYVNRVFEAKYDPTIEDRYQKIIEYEGCSCVLEILDTAGQETFHAMRELYIKTGEGYALIYSITSKQSLIDLEPLLLGITERNLIKDVPIVLVGNKCDLENKRTVGPDAARELAKKYNCPFMESSAKLNINIEEIFHNLIRLTWLYNPSFKTKSKHQKKDKSSSCILF